VTVGARVKVPRDMAVESQVQLADFERVQDQGITGFSGAMLWSNEILERFRNIVLFILAEDFTAGAFIIYIFTGYIYGGLCLINLGLALGDFDQVLTLRR
jgi:hypothetical protein